LVKNEDQKDQAGTPIREYLEWLNACLDREHRLGFDAEALVGSDLSDSARLYPLHGRFYLASHRGQPAGVSCLKELDTMLGELQRMCVVPECRGKGMGRAITRRLIEDVQTMGYRSSNLKAWTISPSRVHSAAPLASEKSIGNLDNTIASHQSFEQLDRYQSIAVFMENDLQDRREGVSSEQVEWGPAPPSDEAGTHRVSQHRVLRCGPPAPAKQPESRQSPERIMQHRRLARI
jgi:GNAT superfamily N-acetyltransferase